MIYSKFKSIIVLLSILALCSCAKSDKNVKLFGSSIELSSKFTFFEKDTKYLLMHGLNSIYLAETPKPTNKRKFDAILKSLLSVTKHQNIQGDAFLVQLYTSGSKESISQLTSKNIHGYSIFTYNADGLNHYYFKKNDESNYKQILKFNNKSTSLFTSRETILLHFASFASVPDDSGIVVFRRELELEPEQLATEKKWSASLKTDDLIDAIYGDGEMNLGVVFKDNAPDQGSTCGFRCTTNIPLSACTGDLSGSVWTCKPVEGGGDCKAQDIQPIASANNLNFVPDLPKLRTFRDSFLRSKPYVRKYIGYYSLFSKYSKSDLESIKMYLQIMPEINRKRNDF